MIFLHDPICLSYASPGHPERPARVSSSDARLREAFPDASWEAPPKASEEAIARAHTLRHIQRLQEPRHFDADTSFHEGIYAIARRASGSLLVAVAHAEAGNKAFGLMRPPGHHAESERAMGFCYLNHAAIAALDALSRGHERVVVWDFDAHHGNGTEAILRDVPGTLYVSVHQSPGYPGTGLESMGNCLNYPVRPGVSSRLHLEALEQSWQDVLKFRPEMIIVSAGFDAYLHDPITEMTLDVEDFTKLGSWLADAQLPTAAILEGGYSDDLPDLIVAFLQGWQAS